MWSASLLFFPLSACHKHSAREPTALVMHTCHKHSAREPTAEPCAALLGSILVSFVYIVSTLQSCCTSILNNSSMSGRLPLQACGVGQAAVSACQAADGGNSDLYLTVWCPKGHLSSSQRRIQCVGFPGHILNCAKLHHVHALR